jgi:hypothetical protein
LETDVIEQQHHHHHQHHIDDISISLFGLSSPLGTFNKFGTDIPIPIPIAPLGNIDGILSFATAVSITSACDIPSNIPADIPTEVPQICSDSIVLGHSSSSSSSSSSSTSSSSPSPSQTIHSIYFTPMCVDEQDEQIMEKKDKKRSRDDNESQSGSSTDSPIAVIKKSRKYKCTCRDSFPYRIILIKNKIILRLCGKCNHGEFQQSDGVVISLKFTRVDVEQVIREHDTTRLLNTHVFQNVLNRFKVVKSKGRNNFMETVNGNQSCLPFTWNDLINMKFQ